VGWWILASLILIGDVANALAVELSPFLFRSTGRGRMAELVVCAVVGWRNRLAYLVATRAGVALMGLAGNLVDDD
jgi:hypothetical protein